jgi:hypothetical protein
MADTTTTTLGLTKPEVGASEDTWGEKINTNFDLVDDALDGTTAVSLDINGGTIDGVTIGATTAPTVTNLGSVATADINGGTIDGTVIGGATPAAGTFTTLIANTSLGGTLSTAAQPNVTSVGTLTGLTVSGSTSLAGASTSADITFGDNDKAIFGAGSDLQIYHNGAQSFISDQGTGPLIVLASGLDINNAANTENMLTVYEDGAVTLYNNGAAKLATTSTGINVTGNATFADNGKAIFGAGSDLQIYHDGSNSRIVDGGVGSLIIQSNQLVFKSADDSEILGYSDENGAFRLYYDGSEKIATTSTGIDVTGTVTADGLTVETGTTSKITVSENTGSGTASIDFVATAAFPKTKIVTDVAAGDLYLETLGNDRLKIANNGDISFYEDTGTTPKMVWSASDESLSIGSSGTATPAAKLIINDAATSGFKAKLTSSAFNVDGNWLGLGMGYHNGYMKSAIIAEAKDGTARANLHFALDSSTDSGNVGLADAKMTITYDGSVGIGTDSPSNTLHLSSTNPQIRLEDTDATGYSKVSGASANIYLQADEGNTVADSKIDFRVDGSQRMVIDSDGKLLCGTTHNSLYNTSTQSHAGVLLDGANDNLQIARYQGTTAFFNRLSNDGDIIDFRKNGTTVGSIGVYAGDYLTIGEGGSAGVVFHSTSVRPWNLTTNAANDDAIDLGASSARFDDIYATNGTIQTSDRNEKQDIAELTDAEQRVAVAAKGLLRKFRWRDAVAEKGDEARTHFGIIAQDLQAAFAAEGLDAGDYAMFISSTWTDEETGEERTRMGVRYSELLAFIIAAI